LLRFRKQYWIANDPGVAHVFQPANGLVDLLDDDAELGDEFGSGSTALGCAIVRLDRRRCTIELLPCTSTFRSSLKPFVKPVSGKGELVCPPHEIWNVSHATRSAGAVPRTDRRGSEGTELTRRTGSRFGNSSEECRDQIFRSVDL
jgi:hypothetical protein